MDITVFTGRMPLEELKRDKPESMKRSSPPESWTKTWRGVSANRDPHIRAFAWVALGLGFSITLWIIYAVLFAYQ